MKKLRVILVVAVIAAMSMGAVYAGWSQGFEYKMHTDAGRFFIDIEITDFVIDDGVVDPEDGVSHYYYENHWFSNEELGQAHLYIRNIYPEMTASNQIIFENKGTLAAKARGYVYREDFPFDYSYSVDGFTFTSIYLFVAYMEGKIIEPGEIVTIDFTFNTNGLDEVSMPEDLTSEDTAHNTWLVMPFRFVQYNE